MPTATGAGPCLDTVGRALPSCAAISFCERRIHAWSGAAAARATLSTLILPSVRGCVPALCQSSLCVAERGPLKLERRRHVATGGVPRQSGKPP